MFTLYPSNRMEYLARLLFALIDTQERNVLSPAQVIVESHGIRHWLQLQLAQQTGIAMNLQFQMPAGFVWDLARAVLKEPVPHVSPFGESVLVWRIDKILVSESFTGNPAAQAPTAYWKHSPPYLRPLKRYQLAMKLASLFEQYIKYRADWIQQWDRDLPALSSPDEPWQRLIWRQLSQQDLAGQSNIHPVYLQQALIERLPDARGKLPEHVFLFGLNTMPEPTMHLFAELAKHTEVHLLHLNPCVEYWGDLRSRKALTRNEQWQAWLKLDEENESTNPLLANLGQQGKRFFNQVQWVANGEISAFDLPDSPEENVEAEARRKPVLHQIQQDILTLRNAVLAPVPWDPGDESIIISSTHNTLREIQVLHDYLLHCFNEDDSLTPGDVLVMCPDIENYAPYVDAVFRRPWQTVDAGEPPRLPCSIADRILLEEEPLVAAFLDLLSLPDSRFEVSGILDYLRIPAVQKLFRLDADHLDTIEWWLREACVHWGINAEHKQTMAGLTSATDTFTWQWGLERLLLGYAWGDEEALLDGQLVLPQVEGQQSALLGNVFLLLDQLRHFSMELKQARSPLAWQTLLQTMYESLFEATEEEQDADHIVRQTIGQFASDVRMANYDQPIELSVVRDWFSHQFARPDTGNHFMTGQITFCSMVPMRSIPFRILCVLGLNDGDFPRQENPVSFDLLGQDTQRPGDRSRRSDDRYLFLETLVSARDKLYLSYQGRSSRNNEVRQPSLVLKELMNYLEAGYGWPGDQRYIRQHPLQPFSPDNFTSNQAGSFRSFDERWLRLAIPGDATDNQVRLSPFTLPEDPVPVEELVRFFDNPLKWLVKSRLNVSLENDDTVIEDVEPFELDTLSMYQLRQAITECVRAGEDPDVVVQREKARGTLPETPNAGKLIGDLVNDAHRLLEAVREMLGDLNRFVPVRLEARVGGLVLFAEVMWDRESQSLLLMRSAKRTDKDELRHWLTHLVAQAALAQTDSLSDAFQTHLFTFAEKKMEKVKHSVFAAVENPETLLEQFIALWQRGAEVPSIMHWAIWRKDQEDKPVERIQLEVATQLEKDPYFHWFFGDDFECSEQTISEFRVWRASLCGTEALPTDAN